MKTILLFVGLVLLIAALEYAVPNVHDRSEAHTRELGLAYNCGQVAALNNAGKMIGIAPKPEREWCAEYRKYSEQ